MGFQRSDERETARGCGGGRANLLLAATVAAGAVAALWPADGSIAAERQPAPVTQEESAAPAAATDEQLPVPDSAMLRAAAFRTSSGVERDAPEGSADDAVMLRMLGSTDIAVPIEDLNGALVTTGSITPKHREVSSTPQQLPAVTTALLPAQPAPDDLSPAAEGNSEPSVAALVPDAGPPATVPEDAVAGQAGRIVSSVNLRTRPNSSAKTLTVLASNTQVTVIGCEYWCEVQADGKRGFVYKRFVRTR